MNEITKDMIIDAARRAAQKAGDALSRSDFERLTGISQYHIYKAFPDGGWPEVKRLAGLQRHPKDNLALDDDALLQEFHRVAASVGELPTWAAFGARASISADVIRRRFGGLQGTLKSYREWLEANHPDSSLLEALHTRSKHEIPPPPVSGPALPPFSGRGQWTKNPGPEYGAPINFRGLRHAPINEQGVVFLFGMVSFEIGFLVEAVHASYPDCEAKRCVDRRRDRWQRVRIEFEYVSSNFREHGHDPAGCDLIVCWTHDWAECPLEVIELRKVIGDLDG